MGKKQIVTNPYDYAYATGRIRALETKLMDSNKTYRLFESKTLEDVARVLLDCGYAINDGVLEGVKENLRQSYLLISSLIPNPEYADALILLNDYHNIKVILKSFINFSSARNNPEESDKESVDTAENDISIFLGENKKDIRFKDISTTLAYPTKYEPIKVFEAVRDQRLKELAPGVGEIITMALRAYMEKSDPGEIDTVIDREYFKKLNEYAKMMRNPFFSRYCEFRADSTNLAILLRTRALDAKVSYMARAIVPGGSISEEKIIQLYEASDDEIKAAYKGNLCEKLAAFSPDYGLRDSVLEFSRQSDAILIELTRKTKNVLFGPEILLAFLVFKEMQTRNINIVITCIRNHIPMSVAKSMMREAY